MAYDIEAQKLAVKTIGTVESSMQWDAINYSDPITVGIAQWFGVRAAAILNRMKVNGTWSGVEPSLNNELSLIPDSDTYWNTRYLTTAEGTSLEPNLTANQSIQTAQFVEDLEAYKDVAVGEGMDPDTDTDAMLMFFTAYHQGPLYALNSLAAATGTPHPTLEQMRDAILADPVLGAYTARYNTAYSIISAHDTSGVPDFTGAPSAPPPTTGGGGPPASVSGTIRYAREVGDTLVLRLGTGENVTLYPNGRGWFIPRSGAVAAPEPPPTEPPAEPPAGDWVDPLPSGVLTSGYGPRTDPTGYSGAFHWGIDLSTPGYAGPVFAPTSGTVKVATDNGNWTAGTYVKMWTDDGLYTLNFYHNRPGSLMVAAGQHVDAGQQLCTEGASGNVTGQHVHFEVYEGQHPDPWPGYPVNPIDPIPVLNSHGVQR